MRFGLKKCMMRDKSGFTLMEMLVVIIILAIMVGAITPSFKNAMNKSINEDGNLILRALYGAQLVYKSKNGTYAKTTTSTPQTSLDEINTFFGTDYALGHWHLIVDDGLTSPYYTAMAINIDDSTWVKMIKTDNTICCASGVCMRWEDSCS